MKIDGTQQTRVTSVVGMNDAPAWSPDSQRLAFSQRNGNYDLYVINADGSGLLRLTDSPGDDQGPVWRPAP